MDNQEVLKLTVLDTTEDQVQWELVLTQVEFSKQKLAGHMGSVKVTVQNLEVVRVDADKNFILVKGAIPGAKGSVVTIKEAVKASK